jgi:hypothetical protein
MKQSRAMARQARALETTAEQLARIEEKLDLLLENFGLFLTLDADEVQIGEPEPTEPIDYEALTVRQLRELADQRGIDLTGLDKKAEIIDALTLSDDGAI